jgi:hypothetical protein
METEGKEKKGDRRIREERRQTDKRLKKYIQQATQNEGQEEREAKEM